MQTILALGKGIIRACCLLGLSVITCCTYWASVISFPGAVCESELTTVLRAGPAGTTETLQAAMDTFDSGIT